MNRKVFLVICLFVSGCGRNPPASIAAPTAKGAAEDEAQVTSGSETGRSRISDPLDEKIWDVIREIAEPATSRQGAARLRAMADRLVSHQKLAGCIASLPPPEQSQFLDLLIPYFELKRSQKSYDQEYLLALKVLNKSISAPRSEELIDDLGRVPQYVFPSQPVNLWDVSSAEHFHKGFPGEVAIALVSPPDDRTQRLYREKLSSASGSLRVVMVWALGRSTREETFDYLFSLYQSATGEERSFILRALNHIPVALEEAAELATEPDEKKSLLRLQLELRQRLNKKGLTLKLMPWD